MYVGTMTWVRDRGRSASMEQRSLRYSVVLAVGALTLLVTVGTLMMHHLEHWTWTSCFYFSVTTLATVGYGDLHPSNDPSRLFVALYVIAGVTTALSAMTIVGRNYLGFLQRRLLHQHDLRRRSQAARTGATRAADARPNGAHAAH